MCGRYSLHTLVGTLAILFEFEELESPKPRYNIAPSQTVFAVRRKASGGGREGVFLRWGLVPKWAKDTSIGYKLINARSETVSEKSSFRDAYKKRRCLIPADGYYEWKKEGKVKQPYYFCRKDRQPFAFAGLWESWSKGEETIESCCIITTDANGLSKDIHDRMPVILSQNDCKIWLGEVPSEPAAIAALLQPYSAPDFEKFPVSLTVNSPKNDRPVCIEPAAAAAG